MDELTDLNEVIEPEEEENQEEIVLATVAEVTANGVKITINGSDEAGDKEYKANSSQLIKQGDRVKIHKNSGTYLIEYVIGSPMDRHPIPSGGSDGQYLVKDGGNDYALKWSTLSVHGIPSGGTADQVLAKTNSTDYNVKWMTLDAHGIPSGGSTGQVLAKNSNTNYDVAWVSPSHDLPTGGTDGQYLVKNGATNYSVKWASAPSSDRLTSSTKHVIYNGSALYADSSSSLGSSSYYWSGCYLSGAIRLGNNTYNTTLGFFGTTPQSKKSVGSSGTLAQLITALQGYGLIS